MTLSSLAPADVDFDEADSLFCFDIVLIDLVEFLFVKQFVCAAIKLTFIRYTNVHVIKKGTLTLYISSGLLSW